LDSGRSAHRPANFLSILLCIIFTKKKILYPRGNPSKSFFNKKLNAPEAQRQSDADSPAENDLSDIGANPEMGDDLFAKPVGIELGQKKNIGDAAQTS
jgi:hypothetical protein